MNIEQIKERHTAAGFYFFSPDTMRFFNSKVHNPTHTGAFGIVYFITSEQFDNDSVRLYTIRQFNPKTCEVDTYEEFQAYATLYQATKALKGIA